MWVTWKSTTREIIIKVELICKCNSIFGSFDVWLRSKTIISFLLLIDESLIIRMIFFFTNYISPKERERKERESFLWWLIYVYIYIYIILSTLLIYSMNINPKKTNQQQNIVYITSPVQVGFKSLGYLKRKCIYCRSAS